jgi:hypothetical protein
MQRAGCVPEPPTDPSTRTTAGVLPAVPPPRSDPAPRGQPRASAKGYPGGERWSLRDTRFHRTIFGIIYFSCRLQLFDLIFGDMRWQKISKVLEFLNWMKLYRWVMVIYFVVVELVISIWILVDFVDGKIVKGVMGILAFLVCAVMIGVALILSELIGAIM